MAKTLPVVIYVHGGVLLQYATAPGFAHAICGYSEDEMLADADRLGINIISWYMVDGWSAVDRELVSMGLMSQRHYDIIWPEDIPF